jgi:ubiquinone/menaquinone biosynthesis C-methylase UbiE
VNTTESELYLHQIPLSQSDRLLNEWGHDLLREYFSIAELLLPTNHPVLELATGSGRMCAVLSCLFPSVVTGDRTLTDHPRVIERVPPEFLRRITFLQFDMEQLPFGTGQIHSVVCMNTLHETEHPSACLQELVRITQPEGRLIVGDFNRTGFDVMQRIHELVYHNDHNEGDISPEEIHRHLSLSFQSVSTIETPLNRTFLATRKL